MEAYYIMILSGSQPLYNVSNRHPTPIQGEYQPDKSKQPTFLSTEVATTPIQSSYQSIYICIGCLKPRMETDNHGLNKYWRL